MKKRIYCVVVTYNRKDCLTKCLTSIQNQSVKPSHVFILDNASTDGTGDLLVSLGFKNNKKDDINFHYIQNEKNEGGAGGFYKGMLEAHNYGDYDALWVMDDDGIPDKDCLKNLLPYLEKHDYISPLVVDIEGCNMMSFEGCSVEEFLKREKNGIVQGCANPFNGILYSKKIIEAIGFPKKEMFIWGDEINYDQRARKAGFEPVMVVNAIHKHPLNRQRYVKYFRHHLMTVPESDWKLFCYVRNRTYNSKCFAGKKNCIKQAIADFSKFTLYYFTKAHQPNKLSIVLSAMKKGYKGDFTGLEKYMK